MEDSLDQREGRVRLSTRSGSSGVSTVQAYDAAWREGALQLSLAGRDDSGLAPVRQRLAWSPGELRLLVGDLPSWSDAPLLEGGSVRSGAEHPLGRLGSGHAPAGLEARAQTESVAPFPVALRTRTVAGARSGTRTSILAELGAARLGATKNPESSPTPLAGLAWKTDEVFLRADLAGNHDHAAAMADLELRQGRLRQTLSLSKIDRGFRHEGLETSSPGSTQAHASAAWNGSRLAVGIQGRISQDSANLRRWSLLGQSSTRLGGARVRLRGRLTHATTTQSHRITPGAEWASGPLRPWAEASWTSGTDVEPALGCSWKGRDLHLDGSSIRRTDGQWEWKVSSSLGLERSSRGSRVEIECAQTGETPRGGGSWIVRW